MGTNSDVVRAVYDAFARGDVETVLGAFDPAIEWREADNFAYADGNPYIGPQAVAEGVFQRIMADLEDFAVVPQHFIEGTEKVAVEGRYQGRVKGTGTKLDAQFVHVWEVGKGKIVRFQQYTDTKQWAEAFG